MIKWTINNNKILKILSASTTSVGQLTFSNERHFNTSAKLGHTGKTISNKNANFMLRPQTNNILLVHKRQKFDIFAKKESINKCIAYYTKPSTYFPYAPKKLLPYLYLSRVDKPIGTWLVYLPGAMSICYAAPSGGLPDLYYLGM